MTHSDIPRERQAEPGITPAISASRSASSTPKTLIADLAQALEVV